MAKLQAFLGYVIAALSLLIMVVLFPSIGILAEPLITSTGLILSPTYTGGEVMQTIDRVTYQTQVHRMVFDDVLIGERRQGFIQVDWSPADDLPAHIDEEIDADGDGQADFRAEVDTARRETTLTPYAPWVLALQGTYRLEESLAIRVALRNPSR
jgi:hypothetical protein